MTAENVAMEFITFHLKNIHFPLSSLSLSFYLIMLYNFVQNQTRFFLLLILILGGVNIVLRHSLNFVRHNFYRVVEFLKKTIDFMEEFYTLIFKIIFMDLKRLCKCS